MNLKKFFHAGTNNPFYLNVDLIEYVTKDIEHPEDRTRIWVHGEDKEYLVKGDVEKIVSHIRA